MLTLLGSILLALFALLIGWAFVDQRQRNRRLSTQLGLPLTYQTEGMEGLDHVSLTLVNGGSELRL